MTRAIFCQSAHKWRFGVALAVAAGIHLAAISLATMQRAEPKTTSVFSGEPPELTFDPAEPNADPQPDLPEPLPTPPAIDQSYPQETATPPPVHHTPTKFKPFVRSGTNTTSRSLTVSAAKVFALSAPRPEYPYEARRQKITGDGIALLTIDPKSGDVIQITMKKSTGNQALDDAALAGFRRWRFKPGSVSSVSCPITFTLTGVAY
jgi:TonB family protein